MPQVNMQIGKGSDLSARDAEGRTPLACAILGEHVDVVTALVMAGANVNASSQQGTPLYMAARWGQPDVVRLLLAHEADINATDDRAGTALHGAAAMGHKEIVELLLEKGADVHARTRSGQTALDVAEMVNRVKVAELLRQRQAAAPQGRRRPTVQMDRGPYERVQPQERPRPARSPYDAATNPEDILGDPNAIRRKVGSFAGLAEALGALEEKSKSEQRSWQQRRIDNRSSLVRAAEAQFAEEMGAVKTIAQKEKASQTVVSIDELLARRQERLDVIYDMLREERRAAILAEREANRAGRTRMSGRGRGRGTEISETTTATTDRTHVRSAQRDPNAPPLDQQTEALLQAWAGGEEDKRPILERVTETDLNELTAVRELAVSENAAQTAAALEGLMLARQERQQVILERIAADEERQQRLEERANARGRGTERGATQEDTTRQGRGRRGRY